MAEVRWGLDDALQSTAHKEEKKKTACRQTLCVWQQEGDSVLKTSPVRPIAYHTHTAPTSPITSLAFYVLLCVIAYLRGYDTLYTHILKYMHRHTYVFDAVRYANIQIHMKHLQNV